MSRTAFRTKRGRCYLDGSALRLESSWRGQWRRYRESGWLPVVLLAGSFLFSLGVVVAALLAGDVRRLLLFGGSAVAVVTLGRLSNYVRGFTADPQISFDAIDHVVAKRGTKGLTRPRFVVVYTADGDTRRRYVMMPSLWLSYGETEFRRAVETLRDAGLVVRRD